MTLHHILSDHEVNRRSLEDEPRPVSAAERIDTLVKLLADLHHKHDALMTRLEPVFSALEKSVKAE